MVRLVVLVVLGLVLPGPGWAGDRAVAASGVTTGLNSRWDAAPLDSTLFDLGSRAGREMILTDSVRGLVHMVARGQGAGVLFDDLVVVHRLSVQTVDGVFIVRGGAPYPSPRASPTVREQPGSHRSGSVNLSLEAVNLEALLDLLAAEHGLTIVSASLHTRLWIRLSGRSVQNALDLMGLALGVPVSVSGTRVRLGPEASHLPAGP